MEVREDDMEVQEEAVLHYTLQSGKVEEMNRIKQNGHRHV